MQMSRKHHGFDPLGDCGKGKCPVCARNNAISRIKPSLEKENFMTDAVAPFVGRFGYPNINVGILAPTQQQEDAWLYDAPKYWSNQNYTIPKIVDFRSSLLNSKTVLNIKQQAKLLELSQDIAMSSKPVDVEIKLKEKPRFRLHVDSYMAPTGAQATLQSAVMTQNPKIHTKVYKVFDDTQWKAQDALSYLYESHFDENVLSKMLSVGIFGVKTSRKLVPTRWSITATDDIIGKHLIDEIKDYNQIDTYQVFFGSYLGNYYIILLFPGVWSYELFETYIPSGTNTNISLRYKTDNEDYYGRKTYAQNTAGGYYTPRLAILEYLKNIKRQGVVVALRFITDEYTMPLGVWVTRESARKAMSSKPLEFSEKELLVEYIRKLVKKKFNANADYLLKRSILLKSLNEQKTLFQF